MQPNRAPKALKTEDAEPVKPRTKKLIGLLVLLPGLVVYFGIVVTLADFLPRFWLVQLVYFVITGIAWAIPVIPLMNWMNKEPAGQTPPASDETI